MRKRREEKGSWHATLITSESESGITIASKLPSRNPLIPSQICPPQSHSEHWSNVSCPVNPFRCLLEVKFGCNLLSIDRHCPFVDGDRRGREHGFLRERKSQTWRLARLNGIIEIFDFSFQIIVLSGYTIDSQKPDSLRFRIRAPCAEDQGTDLKCEEI